MEKNQEVLNAFMKAWKEENYDKMFEYCQKTWKEGRDLKTIELLFSFIKLKNFRALSTSTTSSVARRFTVELTFDDGDKIVSVINLICETAPYKTATYGEWGVNPVSVIKVVKEISEKKQEKDLEEKPIKKPVKKGAGRSQKSSK